MRIMYAMTIGGVLALNSAAMLLGNYLGSGFGTGTLHGTKLQSPLWVGPLTAQWLPTNPAPGLTVGSFYQVQKISATVNTQTQTKSPRSLCSEGRKRLVYIDGRVAQAQAHMHWGAVQIPMDCSAKTPTNYPQ